MNANNFTKAESFISNELKKFRISAKRALLTYNLPQKTRLSKETLLKHLRDNVNVKQFLVAQDTEIKSEKCFQALLVSKTKFDIRNKNLIDIEIDGKTFHAKYHPVKDFDLVAKSIAAKDKNYLSSFKIS